MSRRLVESCARVNIHEIVRLTKVPKWKLLLPLTYPSVDFDLVSAEGIYQRHFSVGLQFATSKTNFVGTRLWLRCPSCSRRVVNWYCPQDESEFLCRHCHNLSYKSQSLHRLASWESSGKFYSRQKRIQRKLRNRWLRRPTKEALISQYNSLEGLIEQALVKKLAKYITRSQRRRDRR